MKDAWCPRSPRTRRAAIPCKATRRPSPRAQAAAPTLGCVRMLYGTAKPHWQPVDVNSPGHSVSQPQLRVIEDDWSLPPTAAADDPLLGCLSFIAKALGRSISAD